MNYILSIVIKITIIIIAILIGILLYYTLIEPYILYKLCLTDSNTCVRLSYWNHENSIIIHMEPIGYWIWFDGKQSYVYGAINGITCLGKGFVPVYPISPTPEAEPNNWICMKNIDSLIDKYENEFNVKKKYLYQRSPKKKAKSTFKVQNNEIINKSPELKGPPSLSVYDVLNIFAKRNIINLD